ncbi:MAG TPA: hypothetical protein VLD63_09535 [Anaerolineales bacterium]|nr:hypothetical protein [Anaerolineales bacterium]
MAKGSVKGRKSAETRRREWPFVVYLWAVGLGFGGYLIVGRLILASRPHPIHWLAGAVGAAVGVPIGWLWYRWRGDVLF